MLLEKLLASYVLEKELSAGYEYQLTYALSRLEEWIGRKSSCDVFNNDSINQWLRDEQNGELTGRSRKNLRTSIVTLWKYAAQKDLCDEPNRVRKVKVPDTVPDAWDFETLARFASGAKQLPGTFANQVSRSIYFHTLIWFCFETGLRRADALKTDVRTIKDYVIPVVQNKTSRLHAARITFNTFNDLMAISIHLKERGDSQWFCPLAFPGCISQLYYWLQRCRELSGVSVGERNRSMQHLRRTGATAVEAESPHSAWKYLGHASPNLARKSYIDRRLSDSPIMPNVNRETWQPQP
jgi:integrase